MYNEKQEAIAVSLIIQDVSQQKHIEAERARVFEKALANKNPITGRLPMCSSCKAVRDDKGSWNQIEAFLLMHTEVNLTHGLCPFCAEKLYADYSEDKC